MKGDFTRNTFNPAKHFSRVLMQQGRVQVDADWNEQTSILLHYIRTVVADLIGPYAAPVQAGGFELVGGPDRDGNFSLTAGRMYVDGILVENDDPEASYLNQPDLHDPPPLDSGQSYGVYLDVWEEHVTALEDPSIREKALGVADTATRARVTWQLKTQEIKSAQDLSDEEKKQIQSDIDMHEGRIKDLKAKMDATESPAEKKQIAGMIYGEQEQIDALREKLNAGTPGAWCETVSKWPRVSQAWLRAGVDSTEQSKNPCIQAPDAKYRGATNQLYRVEIHRGGVGQAVGGTGVASNIATFKWSRDNGSVATRLIDVQGKELTVESTHGFGPNGWVELSNDDLVLNGKSGPMLRLLNVQADTLTFDTSTNTGSVDLSSLNYVRRWDQTSTDEIELVEGAVPVTEGTWIPLEAGIQVWFNPGGSYLPGDYWLIPARVAEKGIEWPTETDSSGNEEQAALPPRGIVHHYAPLGVVEFTGTAVNVTEFCRCEFMPLSTCAPYGYYAENLGIGVDLFDF